MTETEVFEANLNLTIHSQAVLDLLNAYAADPMGNGAALTPDVLSKLIEGLRNQPTTIIFLAFYKKKAVGILTSFEGFSTFNALPLIHISDFYIHPEYRGKQIGKTLLNSIEKKAMDINACKITLEVQQNNTSAIQIYSNAGFSQDIHVAEAGPALFYSKTVS